MIMCSSLEHQPDLLNTCELEEIRDHVLSTQ
jgi:hypothetical protein